MDSNRPGSFDAPVPPIALCADPLLTRAFPAWQAGIRALLLEPDIRLFLCPGSSREDRIQVAAALAEAGAAPPADEAEAPPAIPAAGFDGATLVAFTPWSESAARDVLARWPGPRVCAVDWTDPAATDQLRLMVASGVDRILSEYLPDELPDLEEPLLTAFLDRWAWLPPCVRLPDAPAAEGERSGVVYLGTSDRDFGLVGPAAPRLGRPNWAEVAAAVGLVDGMRPVRLGSLDFAARHAAPILRARAWVLAPESPACAATLSAVARAAGLPAHAFGVAVPSPLRALAFPDLPALFRPEDGKRPSLRALLSPGMALSRAAPRENDENGRGRAAAIVASWTEDAFLGHLRALAAGRDISPFAGLPWEPVLPRRTSGGPPTRSAPALLAACLARRGAWSRLRDLAARYFAAANAPDPIVAWTVEASFPIVVSFDPVAIQPHGAETEAVVEALELEAERLPSSARTWLLLGDARERSGENERAAAAFDRAVQLDDGPEALLPWFAFQARRGAWPEIGRHFREGVKRWPPGTIRSLVWPMAAGPWREALAARRPPGNRGPLAHADSCLQVEFDAGRAVPESFWSRTQILLLTERFADAVAWIDAQAGRTPHGNTALLRTAFLLWLLRAPDHAREALARVRPDMAWDAEARCIHAVTALLVDDLETGLRAWRQLRASAPELLRHPRSRGIFDPVFLLLVAHRHAGEERQVKALAGLLQTDPGGAAPDPRLATLGAIQPREPLSPGFELPSFPLPD